MGRNQEQFFSRWAEKSIQVQTLQAHTLSGSIPGAEDGREPPRPGGPCSKPFTALARRESLLGEEQPGEGRAGQGTAVPPQHWNPDPFLPPHRVLGSGARPAPQSQSWHVLAKVTVPAG